MGGCDERVPKSTRTLTRGPIAARAGQYVAVHSLSIGALEGGLRGRCGVRDWRPLAESKLEPRGSIASGLLLAASAGALSLPPNWPGMGTA